VKLPDPAEVSAQVSPVQHSSRVSQAMPMGTHSQVSDSPHVELPQQSMSFRQRLSRPPQQRRSRVVKGRSQRSPPQHIGAVLPSSLQVRVSRAQPEPSAQAPATQMLLPPLSLQHSMSRSQRPPDVTHWHSPSSHAIRPQQSSSASHAVLPPEQH
jgi:hypothetical protein